MIESYLILAGRIRKELHDLERLVARANRLKTFNGQGNGCKLRL